MANELITVARDRLERAIKALEGAHKTWSECVTDLHMAELHLRASQKDMRVAYGALADVLNHHEDNPPAVPESV